MLVDSVKRRRSDVAFVDSVPLLQIRFTSLIFTQCPEVFQDRCMFYWQIPELFESCWRLLQEAPDILWIYIWWILWIEALHLATGFGMPGEVVASFVGSVSF